MNESDSDNFLFFCSALLSWMRKRENARKKERKKETEIEAEVKEREENMWDEIEIEIKISKWIKSTS